MGKAAPIVAIVGRANVGKSSLFNALIGRREAIVAVEPGTTRDRVSAKASVFVPSRATHLDAAQGSSVERARRTSGTVSERRSVTDAAMRQEPAGAAGSAGRQGKAVRGYWKDFWLVDTAGMKAAEDEFELSIQDQIIQAADSADLIIVVVEAHISVTAQDRAVATMALKSRKPVILVVNKIDKNQKADLSDWRTLGIKQILATSTTQKTGLDDLLQEVAHNLPRARIRAATDRIHLGISGRPNVGKSSLFNKLAAKQQALVAEQAGTTRDVNKLVIRYHEREVELADTAGIRRAGRVERGVEKFSVLRSLSAIEESDICLLVMDAGELNTQLDQKIAGLIKEAGKGLILVVNKWDTVEDSLSRRGVSAQVASSFPFVPWAPLIFTSAQTGQNVTKIYDLALEIDKTRNQKFKTSELNRWLRRTVDNNEPPPSRSFLPKLNYMTQEEDIDFPSFKIFGGHTKYLHWSYKRYLERQFRQQWPLVGTPLKFWFIEKRK